MPGPGVSNTRTLAATPPMGWNSWNMFGSRIHEDLLCQIAEAIVATGFKDCGYEYLVIDDCWSSKSGRDRHGDLVPDPDKFPGGWNDLDMLVIGLQGKGQVAGGGLSFLEYQTQMSLWCMACSPLIIGCDVRNLGVESAGLLMNREVIAVNQDPLGIAARPVVRRAGCEAWIKPLFDGSLALALVNRASNGRDFSLKAGEVGLLDGSKPVRDLWAQQDILDFKVELNMHVQPHETILLKISRYP